MQRTPISKAVFDSYRIVVPGVQISTVRAFNCGRSFYSVLRSLERLQDGDTDLLSYNLGLKALFLDCKKGTAVRQRVTHYLRVLLLYAMGVHYVIRMAEDIMSRYWTDSHYISVVSGGGYRGFSR